MYFFFSKTTFLAKKPSQFSLKMIEYVVLAEIVVFPCQTCVL